MEKEAVPVERVRLDTETVTDDVTVSEDVRKEQIDSDVDADRPHRPLTPPPSRTKTHPQHERGNPMSNPTYSSGDYTDPQSRVRRGRTGPVRRPTCRTADRPVRPVAVPTSDRPERSGGRWLRDDRHLHDRSLRHRQRHRRQPVDQGRGQGRGGRDQGRGQGRGGRRQGHRRRCRQGGGGHGQGGGRQRGRRGQAAGQEPGRRGDVGAEGPGVQPAGQAGQRRCAATPTSCRV